MPPFGGCCTSAASDTTIQEGPSNQCFRCLPPNQLKVYMCTDVYIYICIYVYVHTYIYTCIGIHICVYNLHIRMFLDPETSTMVVLGSSWELPRCVQPKTSQTKLSVQV